MEVREFAYYVRYYTLIYAPYEYFKAKWRYKHGYDKRHVSHHVLRNIRKGM